MVLKPTSVVKPKVVSKLSELAGSWAPASESLDDMFHFSFFLEWHPKLALTLDGFRTKPSVMTWLQMFLL